MSWSDAFDNVVEEYYDECANSFITQDNASSAVMRRTSPMRGVAFSISPFIQTVYYSDDEV